MIKPAAKKQTEKRKRSRHGRVRQYFPFGDIISTAAQTLSNYPDLREILRRAVEDNELWNLLAEAQQVEQRRKDLNAKLDQIGARIRRVRPALSPAAVENRRSRPAHFRSL